MFVKWEEKDNIDFYFFNYRFAYILSTLNLVTQMSELMIELNLVVCFFTKFQLLGNTDDSLYLFFLALSVYMYTKHFCLQVKTESTYDRFIYLTSKQQW